MKYLSPSLIVAALGFCALSARASYGFTGSSTSLGSLTLAQGLQAESASATLEAFDGASGSPTATLIGGSFSVYSGFDATQPASGDLLGAGSSPFSNLMLVTPLISSSLSLGAATALAIAFNLHGASHALPGDYTIFFDPNVSFSDHTRQGTELKTPVSIEVQVLPEPVAAPEPSQVLAGALLLGGAGLVYARRRWLGRNSAKA